MCSKSTEPNFIEGERVLVKYSVGGNWKEATYSHSGWDDDGREVCYVRNESSNANVLKGNTIIKTHMCKSIDGSRTNYIPRYKPSVHIREGYPGSGNWENSSH